MPGGLFAEWRLPDVERAVDPLYVALGHAALRELAAQRRRVRCLHRPEAAVAAAVIRRADRAAAGMRHRPETRDAAYQHAGGAAQLALDADAVRRRVGFATVQERQQHLDQLVLV